MSIYDFNHQEHPGYSANGTIDGYQQRYQMGTSQLNNDFSTMKRQDLSVQLTRPNSKTAILVRQRRAMLEQLSCFLCKGYLIDATTIDECMDSFCKSCIVKYLRKHNNCPKCGTLIHKTNPLCTIRSDKVLQDIVYKLVPGLYDDEMKRRRNFYRDLVGTSSSSDNDSDGSSSPYTGQGTIVIGEKYGVVSHPKPFYKPTDNIDLSIEPQTRNDSTTIYYDNKQKSIITRFTGNMQQIAEAGFSIVESQQFKTYLRCPAKLSVIQLKKLIASKYNICRDDTIHLLYLNESLKDDYSLIDIAYIYDWRGIEHMRLFYIIERALSNSNKSRLNYSPRRTTSSVGVGTSTQPPVKRVCIDPKPIYYEEQNNNVIGMHGSGRTMRPRIEKSSISNLVTPNQVPQPPILRSYGSSRVSSNTPSNSNASTSNLYSGTRDETSSGLTQNKLTKPVETRATRKQIEVSANDQTSRVNINSNPSIRVHDGVSKVLEIRKLEASSGIQGQRQEIHYNDRRQILPQASKTNSTAIPNFTTSNQSPMVTMASLTQARSHNMVGASSSSATTLNNSYRNMIGSCIQPTQSALVHGVNQANRTPIGTPQLAFSFVTERGITIVRRLNNQDGTPAYAPTTTSSAATTAMNTITRPKPILALPGPSSQSSSGVVQHNRQQQQQQQQQKTISSTYNQSTASSSGGVRPKPTTTSTPEGSSSSRHQIKVKPVYKTFVDPTKLKSPNFKKLGYTARH